MTCATRLAPFGGRPGLPRARSALALGVGANTASFGHLCRLVSCRFRIRSGLSRCGGERHEARRGRVSRGTLVDWQARVRTVGSPAVYSSGGDSLWTPGDRLQVVRAALPRPRSLRCYGAADSGRWFAVREVAGRAPVRHQPRLQAAGLGGAADGWPRRPGGGRTRRGSSVCSRIRVSGPGRRVDDPECRRSDDARATPLTTTLPDGDSPGRGMTSAGVRWTAGATGGGAARQQRRLDGAGGALAGSDTANAVSRYSRCLPLRSPADCLRERREPPAARTSARRRDRVRIALGAGTGRLARQSLTGSPLGVRHERRHRWRGCAASPSGWRRGPCRARRRGRERRASLVCRRGGLLCAASSDWHRRTSCAGGPPRTLRPVRAVTPRAELARASDRQRSRGRRLARPALLFLRRSSSPGR